MPKRPLSNLELTVLGLAYLRGPCSVYAIMKELSGSASTYHKSRAGTAYSIAHRLVEFELLQSENELVTITETGKEALREWLTPPIPMTDIAHSADLIRLRFFFLEIVPKERRLQLIDEAIVGLQQFQAQCEALIPENEKIGDYFGVLATASSVLETRARIEWLRLVRVYVETPIEGQSEWASTVIQAIHAKESPRSEVPTEG
jgi:DNA-binding PadR family transcriptional regulator